MSCCAPQRQLQTWVPQAFQAQLAFSARACPSLTVTAVADAPVFASVPPPYSSISPAMHFSSVDLTSPLAV